MVVVASPVSSRMQGRTPLSSRVLRRKRPKSSSPSIPQKAVSQPWRARAMATLAGAPPARRM